MLKFWSNLLIEAFLIKKRILPIRSTVDQDLLSYYQTNLESDIFVRRFFFAKFTEISLKVFYPLKGIQHSFIYSFTQVPTYKKCWPPSSPCSAPIKEVESMQKRQLSSSWTYNRYRSWPGTDTRWMHWCPMESDPLLFTMVTPLSSIFYPIGSEKLSALYPITKVWFFFY